MATWTNPYCGLQHMNGLKRGCQISVQEYSESHATAYVLLPGGGFTSAAEGSFDSADSARTWGERKSIELNAAA